ncbi:hypothetical protein OE810_08960 [Rhodobacteraceae bacterium XHP0102]|nr:hypothetical protein [Rhodobacteraceae bacterium XHP0102]
MSERFTLDGNDYTMDELSDEAKALAEQLSFVAWRMKEILNQQALLNKAKNAYIAELKSEIMRERTGVDFSSFFGED